MVEANAEVQPQNSQLAGAHTQVGNMIDQITEFADKSQQNFKELAADLAEFNFEAIKRIDIIE
jgi:hypothetical protein